MLTNEQAKEVQELYDEYDRLDLLEDRREYDKEEYARANPGFTEEMCEWLHWLVQRDSDTDRTIDLNALDPQIVLEFLVEGEHNNYEGWGEAEILVIRRFVDDLERYNYAATNK